LMLDEPLFSASTERFGAAPSGLTDASNQVAILGVESRISPHHSHPAGCRGGGASGRQLVA
jgi:hypothetical protein